MTIRDLNPRAAWGALALLVLGTVVLLPTGDARAQGGPAVPPAAPSAEQAAALGSQYFDDAIRFVARGQAGIPTVRDFYVKLDARLDLDNVQHEGQMRLWFQEPGLYRQELTTNAATTTKILAADQGGWIRLPDGRIQTLMMSPEGRRTMEQLKDDRERLSDLTQFLTLQTLKGPGVTFTFDGFKKGDGTYAGEWIKVVRRVPGKTNITFWLAYATDPQSGQVVATYPGIVRVDGDPRANIPTEDYILKDWDSPQSQTSRDFRYPRRIEAYSLLRGPDGRTVPTRFLWAIVDDIKINAGIDPSRFARPR